MFVRAVGELNFYFIFRHKARGAFGPLNKNDVRWVFKNFFEVEVLQLGNHFLDIIKVNFAKRFEGREIALGQDTKSMLPLTYG